jgi:hypothetical protein
MAKFSIYTDIDNKEVNFYLHYNLHGEGYTTFRSFEVDQDNNIMIYDPDSFKLLCQVLRKSQKKVKKYIQDTYQEAENRVEDFNFDHLNPEIIK